MKLINGYYTDKNGNRWNADGHSEKRAKELSSTLTDCTGCTDCTDCLRCTNCLRCTDCTGCTDCTDCTDCLRCTGYTENPKRIVSSRIGSRNVQTSIYWTNAKDVQVVCGCFRGDLKDFKESVLKSHKDNTEYKEQYLKLIKVANYNIKNL